MLIKLIDEGQRPPIAADELIATPSPVAADPKPIAQPSRPKQVTQRDLFGQITSVRSLTPKLAIAQLALF